MKTTIRTNQRWTYTDHILEPSWTRCIFLSFPQGVPSTSTSSISTPDTAAFILFSTTGWDFHNWLEWCTEDIIRAQNNYWMLTVAWLICSSASWWISIGICVDLRLEGNEDWSEKEDSLASAAIMKVWDMYRCGILSGPGIYLLYCPQLLHDAQHACGYPRRGIGPLILDANEHRSYLFVHGIWAWMIRISILEKAIYIAGCFIQWLVACAPDLPSLAVILALV